MVVVVDEGEGASPLLPRTKASPYSLRLVPLTNSCVFSSAMFMYPSTDCSSPVVASVVGHGQSASDAPGASLSTHPCRRRPS